MLTTRRRLQYTLTMFLTAGHACLFQVLRQYKINSWLIPFVGSCNMRQYTTA